MGNAANINATNADAAPPMLRAYAARPAKMGPVQPNPANR